MEFPEIWSRCKICKHKYNCLKQYLSSTAQDRAVTAPNAEWNYSKSMLSSATPISKNIRDIIECSQCFEKPWPYEFFLAECTKKVTLRSLMTLTLKTWARTLWSCSRILKCAGKFIMKCEESSNISRFSSNVGCFCVQNNCISEDWGETGLRRSCNVFQKARLWSGHSCLFGHTTTQNSTAVFLFSAYLR